MYKKRPCLRKALNYIHINQVLRSNINYSIISRSRRLLIENAASSAALIIIIELFVHEEATTEFTAVKSLFLLKQQ